MVYIQCDSKFILLGLILNSCLCYLDGLYQSEDNTELPSSSSESNSLARRLFDEYSNSMFMLDQNE